MGSHEDATACYVLQIPKIRHTQPLQQPSCWGFTRKNGAPPAKNGSATATITIKPERLAHLCVEQALLYPWMCFTSWFEGQFTLYRYEKKKNLTWNEQDQNLRFQLHMTVTLSTVPPYHPPTHYWLGSIIMVSTVLL